MKLFYGGNVDDLIFAWVGFNVLSLEERRGRLAEQFYTSLLKPNSCVSRTLDPGLELYIPNNQQLYVNLTTINNNCNCYEYFKTIVYVCAFV